MNFLIIDDQKLFRDTACCLIESEGHYAQPSASGENGLRILEKGEFDAVLLEANPGQENGFDILDQIIKTFPNLPVVMITTEATVKLTVEAVHRGAADFLEKPLTREQLHPLLSRLNRVMRKNENQKKLESEAGNVQSRHPEVLLDFVAPEMRGVMDVILRAARTPASILITGESGTGKSVLARAVHEQSHLAGKPFITVSCASLSRELLESELFGHVRGAFTGSIKDHWGKVKASDGGTLFLDEIGDLPLEVQPKLLRLLQEHEYERVGETITRHADVRIIAATNRDLRSKIREGTFREDLYFRLNVIEVNMPPLRHRLADLIRIANHYLKYFSTQSHLNLPVLSKTAINRLVEYSWPGNLRELRNAIERAVILLNGNEVRAEDLPQDQIAGLASGDDALRPGAMISLAQMEELHIQRVVAQTASLIEAARVLGIDPSTIHRKRKKTPQAGSRINPIRLMSDSPTTEDKRNLTNASANNTGNHVEVNGKAHPVFSGVS